LTGRGKRQTSDLRQYLSTWSAADVPLPRIVLSSSARRALQTAELVLPALGPGVELLVEQGLYHADVDDVLDVVRALSDDGASAMVVGHNPTLQEFTLLLVGDDAAGRSRVEAGFPTAALAVVTTSASTWSDVAFGAGHLVELWTPPR
jgi:phosphohistidine phosphatase